MRESKHKEDLDFELVIRADGRGKDADRRYERLADWTNSLIRAESDSYGFGEPTGERDYIIETEDGGKITPGESKIQRPTKIRADGSTVDRDQAWDRLAGFLADLRDIGALES
ncbi:MAG: hypothetical protein AAFX50_22930 [Acidobacteriota bacterium]